MKRRASRATMPVPDQTAVARRAYEIFQERGGEPGHELDDWLQAEYELMQLPIRKIAELDPVVPTGRQPVRKSLVALVHSALLAGTAGMAHWIR